MSDNNDKTQLFAVLQILKKYNLKVSHLRRKGPFYL